MSLRVVVALVAAALALSGCSAGRPDAAPRSGASSVAAYPDLPRAEGPIAVELRPALPLMTGERRCRTNLELGRLCSPDQSGGYRALGEAGRATIAAAVTAPSADHTSWGTSLRFTSASAVAVRRARATAAGFGGVVLVTRGAQVLAVVPPADLTPRRAAFLGLPKAEAWALVDTFARAQTGSK